MHLANEWQEERMLFAMTGRYESTGDVWKAMDCLTEKLMEQGGLYKRMVELQRETAQWKLGV